MVRGFLLILVSLLAAKTALAAGEKLPEVTGVVGIEENVEGAWLAVRVDVPSGMALAGIAWYNNDDTRAFAELAVATGHLRGPGPIDEAISIAGAFSGPAGTWAELEFAEPVASSLGTLFVVFGIPAGESYASRGSGGGLAVGYMHGSDGCAGWVSGDGMEWLALSREYSFAVLPRYVPADGAMVVKAAGREEAAGGAPEPEILTANSISVGPNPFNPMTTIDFGLKNGQHVDLSIYDIRGRRVVRLIGEHRQAGHHVATWHGMDSTGQRVASGVYFVRLSGATVDLTSRIMMVK